MRQHHRVQERVQAALELQPMTVQQLSMCLSLPENTARWALLELCKRGVVRRHGSRRLPSHRYAYLFELTRTN